MPTKQAPAIRSMACLAREKRLSTGGEEMKSVTSVYQDAALAQTDEKLGCVVLGV